ncbi:MAG: tRNA (adenine-N1)-methyltransferase [bacterium]|nr:tRNA (adenine-N1)-methyltransferase [bacterium]
MTVFQAGDACLLFDRKGRRYLIELIAGAEFHHHHGVLPHDEMIGIEEGTTVRSSKNRPLTLMRPRLADYALKMPRGAAVVYPKDVGAILVWADIQPGNLVLEAGTGSGALTMALARAAGATGKVVSYELREDHAKLAKKRIKGFFGDIPDHIDLRLGSVEEGLPELRPDRIVLDVPEPWHAVPGAATNLAPGGIFCCYVPTVPQVQEVRRSLDQTGAFLDIMTFEIMMREWAVDGRSVRPSHRMIGHTGFITVARKLEPAGD